MGCEENPSFDACWPIIARDIERVLTRRGLELHTREDIIQETAIRLYRLWDGLDKQRPVSPLGITIALNLMRDGIRRGKREVMAEIEGQQAGGDVEREGLAKLELSRVLRAMTHLSNTYREVLLEGISETGLEPANRKRPARSTAAMKMLRMRARRRLATFLEASGAIVVAVRLRVQQSLGEPGHAVAVALSAGVIAVAAFNVQQPASEPPIHRAAADNYLGDVEAHAMTPQGPSVIDHASAVAIGTDLSAASGNLIASLHDHPSHGGAHAEADIQVDPSGETVVDVDAGVARARVVRNQHQGGEKQDYSLCLSSDALPDPSGPDCDEE